MCGWLCRPVGCLITWFFCSVSSSFFYCRKAAPPCSLKLIYMHSSLRSCLLCESYQTAPQFPLKVQDLLLLAGCVVLLHAFQRQTLSLTFIEHSLSPNQCMWSVVVVSAASVATDDYKPQANFVFSSTCLCSLMGVSRDHRIPNSASHHFSKIHFFEKQTKKKDYCLDMFFISQNLYCFKNSWAIIPMTCFFVLFFLCRICWSRNCKEGFQQFDSVFYLLNWMTEVRRVFCVRASVWTRVTDMTGCIANWFNPVLQVRKSSVTC